MMTWIVPSIIIVSVAATLESLVTCLGSGLLACLAIIFFLLDGSPTESTTKRDDHEDAM